MNDISQPEIVEIFISEDGKNIWINTGYECVLRASKIRRLILTDKRKKK